MDGRQRRRTDARGYIVTGPDLLERGARPAGWPLDRDLVGLETSVPGLFAAATSATGRPSASPGAVAVEQAGDEKSRLPCPSSLLFSSGHG